MKIRMLTNKFLYLSTILLMLALLAVSAVPHEFHLLTYSLVIGFLFFCAYFTWRGFIKPEFLPKTGIDYTIPFFLLGILISLIFSPQIGIGSDRIAWFFIYAVLFYILCDLLQFHKFKFYFQFGILFISGLLLLLAVLEIDIWYQHWISITGSIRIAPPFPYRFTGLLGANYFMAFENLCAPIALLTFLETKRVAHRVLLGFWLVLFVITAPFSSSRSGWLGIIIWLGVLIFFWGTNNGILQKFSNHVHRHPIKIFVIIMVISIIAGASGIWLYKTFAASNPSHGDISSLNREAIWAGALEQWKSSPWVGIGPGRTGLGYIHVAGKFPTIWWPKNAHSIPIQFLAEFGLAGFIPLMTLAGSLIILLARIYKTSLPIDQRNMQASIAAIAGAFAFGFFGDFTNLPLIMFVLIYHAASILSKRRTRTRFQGISSNILLIPAAVTVLVGIFNLWSYSPIFHSISESKNVLEAKYDWQQAAIAAEESARRNPTLSLYQFEAGVAWALSWKQTGNKNELYQAIKAFNEASDQEKYNSLIDANIAVLEWQAGNKKEAFTKIKKAISLSPLEPNYLINYGWFLEQSGLNDDALLQYQSALRLSPQIGNHPFWKSSSIRKKSISNLNNNVDELDDPPFWKQSIQHSNEGDILPAKLALELSKIYLEPELAQSIGNVYIQMEIGSDEDIYDALSSVKRNSDFQYWQLTEQAHLYTYSFGKISYPQLIVPGFIKVSQEQGQITLLQKLYDIQVSTFKCNDAAATWATLQRELRAGALVPGGYPPAPACP